MSMYNYSQFFIRITDDQIKKASPEVCKAYMNLIGSFPDDSVDDEDEVEIQYDVDLESLAEVLQDGYDGEFNDFVEEYPEIVKAYEAFREAFKLHTGLDIHLKYVSSDAEINGNCNQGANWELDYDQCYVPSKSFLSLEDSVGTCYHEHYVTFS